jgi:hypothetical protein
MRKLGRHTPGQLQRQLLPLLSTQQQHDRGRQQGQRQEHNHWTARPRQCRWQRRRHGAA